MTRPQAQRHLRKPLAALIALCLLAVLAAPAAAQHTAGFERVGAVAFESAEIGLNAAVVDPAGNFAYFVTNTNPGRVVKVNLTTFERVGAITLATGERSMNAAAIDPAGEFAYFAGGGTSGRLVKVNLATFERVGALLLGTGNVAPIATVIDSAGDFAYIVLQSNPGRVVKVNLDTFAVVGTLILPADELGLTSAVIDPAGRFAYLSSSLSRVVKIDLTTFERVGAMSTTLGESPLYAALMDPAGEYAYFGWSAPLEGDPGGAIKVDLGTFAQVDSITFESGETAIRTGVIHPAGDHAYFGGGPFMLPARVVQVDLETFERIDAVTFASDESGLKNAAVIHPSGDHAYFGTSTLTGRVVKVALTQTATVGPVAGDDAYGTAEDTPLVVPAPGVLGNDTDVDTETLTAGSASEPANGSVVLAADGSFTYTPDADFNGTDTFTYTVSDGNVGTDTGTVTITVTAAADALVAVDDAYTTAEDTALNVPAPGVLGNDTNPDGGALTASSATDPAGGSVTLAADGSFTYTPDAAFNGTDTFTYTVSDGNVGTDTGTVTITVTAAADAPVAVDDAFVTGEDAVLTVAAPGVLGNDTDGDGNNVTAGGVTMPANGTVTVNADGGFVYTPNPNFSGTDTFTYTVSDGTGLSDTGLVTITVTATNGSAFHPMTPSRIIDSRAAPATIGPYNTPWAPGETRDVTVTGASLPAGADAVTLNVTVTNTTGAGFLTIWPKGQAQPNASNLNWAAGQTIPNAVTVKVGAGGQISVANPFGSTHVIIDIVGYYDGQPGDGYTPLDPARILDSRTPATPADPYSTPWGPGTTRQVTVAGAAGVPANADAVVLNATVTGTTGHGFLTIWPNGQAQPNASSLNWAPGQTIPNAVTVKVGAGGQVSVFNPIGNADVIFDVVGYFAPGTGHLFHPLNPARIVDSRQAAPNQVGPYATPWPAATNRDVPVSGNGGVPAGAAAALLNVTATSGTATSYLSIWPAGQPAPVVSSLNWTPGITIPNSVTTKLNGAGAITMRNEFGTVHVIADTNGWYG